MCAILVYMTAPDMDTARKIGRTVVENKLAACVNMLPGMESVYWWDSAVCTGQEVVLIAKTRADLWDKLRACVCAVHPYEVPCIVHVNLDGGHEPFLRWIETETREDNMPE